ncbi:MAG: pyrimidine dimer DNA glycosylase [Ignavibacteriales bacterium]|nr:pyrimidine dimer DNA glycosylase [Ignavibacteriales bacterium]
MRIWDLPPKILCRQHLLGEHRELHAIWSVLTKKKKGYSHHPETLRWVGKLHALYNRHELLIYEMQHRGYNHKSPLDKRAAKGLSKQNIFVDTPRTQRKLLRNKKCNCKI